MERPESTTNSIETTDPTSSATTSTTPSLSDAGNNPFQPPLNAGFLSPLSPSQSFWSPSGARRRTGRVFKSTRIDPVAYKQERTPWHETKFGKSALSRTRWTCLSFSSIGLMGVAALLVTAYLSVPQHEYCLVMSDEFDGDTLDTSVWKHEVQLGGFGNGEFEMTTADPTNSFVEDGKLYIVPTLSNETYGDDAILNGLVLNFTADGTCTSTVAENCVTFSNNTASNYSVIPPIRSARLTTKLSHSIAFGKVEVKARLPTGDWIWPAIWMLPRDEVYGSWPASGEIDMVESRGNKPLHEWDVNANSVTSTLHWGLDTTTDKYSYTNSWRKLKRKYLDKFFYTYGLQWDPKGLRTYLSKPSRAIVDVKFNEPFFARGELSSLSINGTNAVNPWTESKYTNAAPFDQEFYLILSVAVGGTNGWFPDAYNKPWGNSAVHAKRDFWLANEAWLPSWPTDPRERGMAIESVKMWRLKDKTDTDATCRKS